MGEKESLDQEFKQAQEQLKRKYETKEDRFFRMLCNVAFGTWD